MVFFYLFSIKACKTHYCEQVCHSGECPPCPKTRIAKCECGMEESQIKCVEEKYHCDRICGKALSCGNHTCEIVCHTGECPPCPMEGSRSCHCGKVLFENLSCDEATPSCEDTCNKPLHCYGNHRCNRRCHPGGCDQCRMHIVKPCRCGFSKKSVQCYQEFICEKRCTRLRNCKKHQCKKKCCKGDCPPCNETCGNILGCGNHRCQAICHPYACFPCSITTQVSFLNKTQSSIILQNNYHLNGKDEWFSLYFIKKTIRKPKLIKAQIFIRTGNKFQSLLTNFYFRFHVFVNRQVLLFLVEPKGKPKSLNVKNHVQYHPHVIMNNEKLIYAILVNVLRVNKFVT